MSDRDLAKNVKDAAEALNASVREAHSAGLRVDIDVQTIKPTTMRAVTTKTSRPINVDGKPRRELL